MRGTQLKDGRKTASIFMNNRCQAVRLPKEFRFRTSRVYIERVGDAVILRPKPEDWTGFLESGLVVSEGFMTNIEALAD